MGMTMGMADQDVGTTMMASTAAMVAVETAVPTSPYDYNTATFEIILPAIFGIFISLTLG